MNQFNQDFYHRRIIRLQGYDYTQQGLYFITICTHKRKMMFSNTVGAALRGRPEYASEMIVKWLMELENKFPGVQIDKYIVMPNHIHFILNIKGGHTGPPLQGIINWFKTMTTNEYIKGVKYGMYKPFNKRIWQRSYYDHIIRNEQDYIHIAEYIQNNPAKWQEDRFYIT